MAKRHGKTRFELYAYYTTVPCADRVAVATLLMQQYIDFIVVHEGNVCVFLVQDKGRYKGALEEVIATAQAARKGRQLQEGAKHG